MGDFQSILNAVIEHFTPHNRVELIGTYFGIGCMLLAVINYVFTNRDKIIIIKLVSNFLCVINNLCYGHPVPAALNMFGMFRETVFFFRGKKKWADKKFWIYIIIPVMVGIPILINALSDEWVWMELLCSFASLFSCLAFYSQKTVTTKICMLITQTTYVFYHAWVGNASAFVTSIIPIISIVIGLIREYNKYKKNKAAQNTETAPEDNNGNSDGGSVSALNK